MKILLKSFEATGTSGRNYTVKVWQKQIPTPPFGFVKGLSEAETSDGQSLNAIDDGKFQMVRTGEILTPNQPLEPFN